MAVSNPLYSDKRNVLNIYDSAFDDLINYQTVLVNRATCFTIKVDVEDVIFCNDNASLYFVLPCIPTGSYKVQIINSLDSSVIYDNISAITY
jgi:hypothetical protein